MAVVNTIQRELMQARTQSLLMQGKYDILFEQINDLKT